jgi:hypothetical protein
MPASNQAIWIYSLRDEIAACGLRTTLGSARGEYLARAGDCVACHTAAEGPVFAGSRAMSTPFGTIYSTNITPDRETGIGKWSADDFYSTMHNGRFPDGGLIYPVMPFASYTKVTRADCDAIFAYLKSILRRYGCNRQGRVHVARAHHGA